MYTWVMERGPSARGRRTFRTVAVLATLLVSLSGCVADLAQIQATGSVPLSGRSTLDLCDAAIRARAAQYDPVSIETSLTNPVQPSWTEVKSRLSLSHQVLACRRH